MMITEDQVEELLKNIYINNESSHTEIPKSKGKLILSSTGKGRDSKSAARRALTLTIQSGNASKGAKK